MTTLMTKDDVVMTAFPRDISILRFPDALIHSAEIRHIMPIVGEEFYNAIIASPASYTALIAYIKPALAYFTKHYLLPDIYADVSNTGINKIQGNNRVTGDSSDLGIARQTALDDANLFVESLTKYLNDNETSFPLYKRAKNPVNNVDIFAGIISRKYNTLNDDDE